MGSVKQVYYSMEEAAEFLGIPYQTFAGARKRGDVKPIPPTGKGKRDPLFFTEESLQEYAAHRHLRFVIRQEFSLNNKAWADKSTAAAMLEECQAQKFDTLWDFIVEMFTLYKEDRDEAI